MREHLGSAPTSSPSPAGTGRSSEAARALAGSDVPLAILPAGTTNVVAREYGLGTSPEEAEALLGSTTTRTLTTWPSAGRTSLIGTGVGFDARVMANVNPLLKRLFGRAGFALTSTLEWYRYEFPPIEVTGLDADGPPFVRRATFVLRRTRASTRATPSSRRSPTRDDDLLDLVLFTSEERGDLFQFYRLLPGGRGAARRAGRRAAPVRSFTARSLAGYELEVQVDGDAAGTTPVTVGPAGGKVRLLVPPGAGA